jgi:hypothetical protein
LNPLKIDTASGTAAATHPITVSKIRWVGATTAGHTAVIQDQYGNHFWDSICPGDNYVEESDFTTYETKRKVLSGITVPTLGSGILYIYE